MKVIDEVCPKVKGDMRLVDDSTLWVKTDRWKQIRRIIAEDSGSNFGKVFYEGTDDERFCENCERLTEDEVKEKVLEIMAVGFGFGLNADRYCPNCGARMKGADDE